MASFLWAIFKVLMIFVLGLVLPYFVYSFLSSTALEQPWGFPEKDDEYSLQPALWTFAAQGWVHTVSHAANRIPLPHF